MHELLVLLCYDNYLGCYLMIHMVYIIECVNGSYYTGYTTDIERRFKEHQRGTRKCKYTRAYPPKRIAAYWTFSTRSDALSAESIIKKKSKSEKQKLIQQWWVNI